MLMWLRLTKSGIEYVILAGSLLFPLSEAESRFWGSLVGPWRAQRAIFSGISTFWHLKSQNFFWPAGAWGLEGREWPGARANVGTNVVC